MAKKLKLLRQTKKITLQKGTHTVLSPHFVRVAAQVSPYFGPHAGSKASRFSLISDQYTRFVTKKISGDHLTWEEGVGWGVKCD